MALNNVAINLANGATTVPGTPTLWPGGSGTCSFGGTFNSATYVLETMSADGTWVSVPGAVSGTVTGTAAGVVNFNLGRCMVRANATSFSTTSVLTMTVTPFAVSEG